MRRAWVLVLCLAATMGVTTPVPAAAAPGDDKWALLIGVDQHQGTTRTNVGAVGDVEAFHSLLTRNGWSTDRIRVLTDSGATQAAIRQGLQWIVDNCGPESQCVVHYSGHTKQMNNVGGSEGLHEYLWPHDNRFISDTEFADYMRRLRGHAWIDISACEAAGFDNGISSPRRLFTAASQEHEKGYEDPSWRQSVWTGLLVDRAMLRGRADANGDGHVTLAEALPWATELAPRYSTGQSHGPQHPYRAGGEETNFFPAPAQAPAPKSCFLLIFCS